jgi:predicted Ser/Thr protein kinase
MSEFYKLLF